MHETAERVPQLIPEVFPISASLRADGSIDVKLYVEGYDEPQELQIAPTIKTIMLAGAEPRLIDLEGGRTTDALVRRLIDERVREIRREYERRLVAQQRRQAAR